MADHQHAKVDTTHSDSPTPAKGSEHLKSAYAYKPLQSVRNIGSYVFQQVRMLLLRKNRAPSRHLMTRSNMRSYMYLWRAARLRTKQSLMSGASQSSIIP